MKSRYWILPLILLIALLGAGYFRWDEKGTRTIDSNIYKWSLDRWTGQTWLETYSTTDVRFEPLGVEEIDVDRVWNKKDDLTTVWEYGLGASAIWFLYVGFIAPWLKEEKQKKVVKVEGSI